MIHHITYASEHMTISAKKCVESAKRFGCNRSNLYTPSNINREFYSKHKDIFETKVLDANGNPRGAGFWLWKPYIINEALKGINHGDILVYTDAGLEFVADVQNLISEMTCEIMLFGNGWRHGDWCKMDVLVEMEALAFVDYDQVQASCIIIEKNDYTLAFVEAWLDWCEQPGFIDDTTSFSTNEPTFREHRHDQAILTNLAYQAGVPLNRWPAQYKLRGNENYSNKYGTVFMHLRKRNNEH